MRQISHNISEYLNRAIASDERNMGIEVPSHDGDGSDELRERLNMLERDIRRLARAWDERNATERGSSNMPASSLRDRHRDMRQLIRELKERAERVEKERAEERAISPRRHEEMNELKQRFAAVELENYEMKMQNLGIGDNQNDNRERPESRKEKGSIRRRLKEWIRKEDKRNEYRNK